MNKEEIKKILPHREPMLLVDEVELIDGVAHGKCHIKGDEFFLQGHFPGNPVVPGVIQCEMMAQSACVLLAQGASEGCTPLFTSLDKVKFRGQVKPGDTLETECEITRQRGNFYFAKGKGMVGIKGRRLVGGFRASIYNALPIESVQALVDCMRQFEKIHAK